ncbi:flagellin hook IN motif-containing protein, partial [Chelatococcus sp. SYSU_G07232]
IQNRLATGKKVNSALDNPSNFFLSAGLNARGSDLSNLLDTMGQNIKVLEAADKGITAITKLVESTQATARQALQSASVNLKTTGTANLSAYTAAAGDAGNLVITVGGTNKTVAVAAGDTGAQIVDKINAAGGLKAELDAGTGRLSISALNGESLAIDATSTAATLTALGLSAGAVTRGTSEVNATRKALAAQVAELRTQIDQLSKDASYNGINLLAGD